MMSKQRNGTPPKQTEKAKNYKEGSLNLHWSLYANSLAP